MTLTANSQADSKVTFSHAPFPAVARGLLYMPSKVTTDWVNRRIYTASAYDGMAAIAFDARAGSSSAWSSDQSTGSFLTLVGPANDRVLVAADMGPVEPDALGAPQHSREAVVWRPAATGREMHRENDLLRNFGLTLTPDREGGILYATRQQGFVRLAPAGPAVRD